MAEWQPIESAPRDGTAILGFGPGRRPPVPAITVVAWDMDRAIETFGRPGFVALVGAWPAYADSQLDLQSQPTHWMPLPAAPQD
jgi:hypothetical protein